MCHAPEIIYRIPSLYGHITEQKEGSDHSSPRFPLPLMRASDDFFPDDPFSHNVMIASLAYNSLLLGHLSTPDWDMFQSSLSFLSEMKDAPSHNAIAKMHAVARSISGGPIYVSDVPGESDPDLLNKVVCDDGTVLPCAGVALPVREQLLLDPLVRNRTMILWNVNGLPGDDGSWKFSSTHQDDDDSNIDNEGGYNTIVTSGVLGLFHLGGCVEENTTVTLKPQQVEAFQNKYFFEGHQKPSFFLYSYNTRRAWVLENVSDEVEIQIPSETEGGGLLWCDVVSIIPITVVPMVHQGDLSLNVFDIVPLGLLDKFNGPGAVLRVWSSAPYAVSKNNDQQEGVAAKIDLSVRGSGEFAVLARARVRSDKGPVQWVHSGIRAKVTVDDESVDRVDLIQLWDEEKMANDPPVLNRSILGLEKEGFDLIKFHLPPPTKKINVIEERWVNIEVALKHQ